ncbi:MAG: hypothetical protein AB2L14_36030 [Candidatus Xenobiia bacterium LiM19]
MNSTALKPVNSAAIQPAHSVTPAIPVESAIPSAQTPAPASEDVLKYTIEGETLQEPGTVPEIPLQLQGSLKYHEKLVVDLDAE